MENKKANLKLKQFTPPPPKNPLTKFLIVSNLILLFSIIIGIITFSGGWHIPEEILSGTFKGTYNFSKNVIFQNKLNYDLESLGTFTSCKDILDNSYQFTNFQLNSGIYKINPDGNNEFEVYCDMITDGGGWTLIESFSLENKDIYKSKPFYEDLPRNENTPKNFEDFRLSLNKMEYLVDISTEVRAGCNMEINPSKDYVFFDLSELNILTYNAYGDFIKTRKLNIRGNIYENEDIKWWQGYNDANDHLHIDSHLNNIPNSMYSEDNFGFYKDSSTINSEFSCTSSQSSTTNWYLR